VRGNEQVVPIELLNVAVMSLEADWSLPASLLASACGYQVFATGAPGKSRCTVAAPAWPSVALDESQESGSIWAPTRIVTVLASFAPQMSAAYWKAASRCAPSVVALLLPTAATTVGSLKPSPAPSRFTTVTTAASSRRAHVSAAKSASRRIRWRRI
jgi:hypothetical protein